MKVKPREGTDFNTFRRDPDDRQSGWLWSCTHCVSDAGLGWRWSRVDARSDARKHCTTAHGVTNSGS